MWRAQAFRVLAAVTAAAGISLVSISHAFAEICGDAQVHKAGYYHSSGHTVRGTLADITVRFQDLCSGGSNVRMSAWVMLQEKGSPYGYAQVGHIRYYGEPTAHFAQWDDDWANSPGSGGGFHTVIGGTVPTGSVNGYWVYNNTADDRLDMNVGFTHVGHTSWDPYDEWNMTNLMSNWSGETHHDNQDIFGSFANQEVFGNLRVQEAGSSSYAQNPYSLHRNMTGDSTWNLSGIAWNSFNEWDDD